MKSLPPYENDLDDNEWESLGIAVAHNLAGETGNKDYRGRGERGGQQAIYNRGGFLVTSEENKGTYDFEPPEFTNKFYLNHAEMDVKPWVEWGNSEKGLNRKKWGGFS